MTITKDRTLQTDRLTLRPLSLDDSDALHEVFRDPQAMRFMPSLPHSSIAVTRKQLADEIDQPGACYWSIYLRDSDRPIGIVNYLGNTVIPGMGYIIHRDYWGQGITVEACRAALQYGFDELNLDRVELWIEETNAASQRVAQKLGFRAKGQIALKYGYRDNNHVMNVYGLWAEEWRGEPRQPTATQFYRAQPVLMVHDVAATVEYYRDKLGFTIDFLFGDPPEHAGVSRGDWTAAQVTLQITKVPKTRDLTPSTYVYIFVDASLDQLCDTYRTNGVTIVREPESYPWGMREFVIKDLNGHILQFGTHG